MKKEIRGLKPGLYWNKDDTVSLEVVVNDIGIRITSADYESDSFWEFVIDPASGQVIDSEVGSISENQQ